MQNIKNYYKMTQKEGKDAFLKSVILLFIIFYKKTISPWLPAGCRFYPTCSMYLYQAIKKHGILKGMKYGVKRLLRCHPFHEGGYDPVPEE